LVFLALIIEAAFSSEVVAKANGLGEHIEWQQWTNGLAVAKNSGKPLMVVLHKTWCPACKALKPKFELSKALAELSSEFVMVNAKEGQEPMDEEKLNIDGSYIPRIIFLNSEANVLKGVINDSGNPSYKYYHMEADSIVQSMKKALKIVKTSRSAGDKASSDEL